MSRTWTSKKKKMVAPVMRCSTQDHMPGSPRYRVRLFCGAERGAGMADSAAAAVLISTSNAVGGRMTRQQLFRVPSPNLGATLIPICAQSELACEGNGEPASEIRFAYINLLGSRVGSRDGVGVVGTGCR